MWSESGPSETALQAMRQQVQHDGSTLSSSLLAGLLVFACFPVDGSYVSNADIARRLGLNPSTAHRYVSTLASVGLLKRHPTSRKYGLSRPIREARSLPPSPAGRQQ